MAMRSIHRNRNTASLVLLGGVLALAFGLHLGQAYTGPFWLPRAGGDYGLPGFETGSPAYPRQVVDAEGNQLKIERPPRTFAATDWEIEEFLYSVVPPEKIVGVSGAAYNRTYSNVYQFAEKYRPAVVGTISPNAELVVKADPELVITTPEQVNVFNILKGAGVPAYRMFTQFRKLDEIARNILLVGYISGHDQEARRVYDDFQAAVARAKRRKPAGAASPRVLGYQFVYSYGRETLFNDIVETVGGINVGAEHGLRLYDAVNSEQVLRWDPDWIVTGANRGESDQTLRRLLSDPALRLTAAARNGRILVLDMNVFLPRSPFTARMLAALGDALWGPERGS